MLSRTILLHVILGHSLRDTAVHVKLAKWANVSNVALPKRYAQQKQGYVGYRPSYFGKTAFLNEKTHLTSMRIVYGATIKEPGRTGSQWRIVVGGEGDGESLNRLPVSRRGFIVADAGYLFRIQN